MKALLAFSIGLMIFVSAADAMESDDQGNIYSRPPDAEVYITQEPIIGTTNDDYILMIEPWLASGTHTLTQDLWIGGGLVSATDMGSNVSAGDSGSK